MSILLSKDWASKMSKWYVRPELVGVGLTCRAN